MTAGFLDTYAIELREVLILVHLRLGITTRYLALTMLFVTSFYCVFLVHYSSDASLLILE